MKSKVYIGLLQFCLLGCTLIPSYQYLESDNLDDNLTIQDMEGTYIITNEALSKLKEHYSNQQIDSIKYSFIVINPLDTLITIYNAPLNESIEENYSISSGKGKLFVYARNHPKFRFIKRPDSQYPNLQFRQIFGENSILINLQYDPDWYDYYEYVLQK